MFLVILGYYEVLNTIFITDIIGVNLEALLIKYLLI